jgi:probable phosphoglycerate mutase
VSTILLIRHAENDTIGRLIAGWQPGVHLNARGRRQAILLAERLGRRPITRVIASPLERTIETAQPLGRRLDVEVETQEEFGEIRFGAWTGRSLSELDPLEQWQRWNRERASAPIPGGEMMLEVQQRVVSGIARVSRESPDGVVAIVSHGDPIRAAICHYLGLSLDCLLRFEIATASVSEIEVMQTEGRAVEVNRRLYS